MDKEGKKLTNKNHVPLFPIAECWRVDNLIGNNIIQNTIIRNRFCEILQNLHFADNMYDDKTDTKQKVCWGTVKQKGEKYRWTYEKHFSFFFYFKTNVCFFSRTGQTGVANDHIN